VIIPTYNRVETAQLALGDVLAQNHESFEVIVVDDGSDDSTFEDLSRLAHPRLRVIRCDVNQGPALARNAGAAIAAGEWLTFLDDDDRVDDNWLATFDEHTHDPDVAVVCCDAVFVNQAGDVVGDARSRPLGPLYGDIVAQFAPATFAVRASLFEAVGAYDPQMTFGENYELGMRLGRACTERGWNVAVDDRRPMQWTRRRAPLSTPGVEARYGAAARLLEKYASELPADRDFLWWTLSIAGINAARLGNMHLARRHLWNALLVRPARTRSWLRFALSCSKPLAQRTWGAYR
jgi:glycosyltransferase involved in cell wall biosynthesis